MKREFALRPMQTPAYEHIHNVPNCAVWMDLGGGKTTLTISALMDFHSLGYPPALIVAPPRVAAHTWPNEIEKWGFDFPIVPIIGTPEQRKKALQKNAGAYTVSFNNVPWLAEQFRVKKARFKHFYRSPFDIIVVDEARKLHRTRVTQGVAKDGAKYLVPAGGAQADALFMMAIRAQRVIELTGAPAPNGLKDLYGQILLLDKGVRLGNTWTGFVQRWFQLGHDGYSVEPLPHADAEIHARLQDICLTIKASDYFDLTEPVVTEIPVQLPAKAMQRYRDMERHFFTEFEHGGTAEAVNAAVKAAKCLARGTEVLTAVGWLAIENVTVGTEVWDGVEWVACSGAISTGVKNTICCRGVFATPDHLFLTEEGWATAEKVSERGESSKRFNWHGIRVSNSDTPSRFYVRQGVETGYVASEVHMRERNNLRKSKSQIAATWFKEVLWMPTWRDVSGRLGDTRADKASALRRLVKNEVKVPASARQRLEELRSAGDSRVGELGVFCPVSSRYGSDIRAGAYIGEDGQQRRVLQRELPVGLRERAVTEYPENNLRSHTERPDEFVRGRRTLRGETGDYAPATPERVGSGRAGKPAETFDIVNAGPRRRFVVRGSKGEISIAHNCLQIASGCVYTDQEVGSDADPRSKEWVEVHDAKLQALESVVSEANGAPVIVAYWFKSDLVRLKKAFPKGREFDDKAATLRDFSAGKIEVLFLHPQSAAHGVDGLQNNCRHMVFFSPIFDLDLTDQTIGRIGPVRQMQAGKAEPVLLYYLVAEGTLDEAVMQRLRTKRSVQDVLKEAMNHRKGALR